MWEVDRVSVLKHKSKAVTVLRLPTVRGQQSHQAGIISNHSVVEAAKRLSMGGESSTLPSTIVFLCLQTDLNRAERPSGSVLVQWPSAISDTAEPQCNCLCTTPAPYSQTTWPWAPYMKAQGAPRSGWDEGPRSSFVFALDRVHGICNVAKFKKSPESNPKSEFLRAMLASLPLSLKKLKRSCCPPHPSLPRGSQPLNRSTGLPVLFFLCFLEKACVKVTLSPFFFPDSWIFLQASSNFICYKLTF